MFLHVNVFSSRGMGLGEAESGRSKGTTLAALKMEDGLNEEACVDSIRWEMAVQFSSVVF